MSELAAPPATRSVARFPLRVVSIGVAAMVIIAAASAITAWTVGERIRLIGRSQLEVIAASERLQRQSELLQVLSEVAINTGQLKYATQYRQLEVSQRDTLVQLEGSIRLPENRTTFRQVEQAQAQIAVLEQRALRSALAGRREQAYAILRAGDYQEKTGRSQKLLMAIENRSRKFVEATRAQTDRYLSINFAVSLVALLVIGFAWLLVVRPARTWGRELREAHAAAEQATRVKSDFLAVMSHEIRTPLNSIIGFAELLLSGGKLNREEQHQVEIIEDAGVMLLTVVNDLLDFSKIEAGKIELSPEPFAIETLIDNSVSIVRGAAEGKGVEMRVDVDSRLSSFYLGDENRLRQVLLNLLNNGVKFTSAGSVSLSVVLEENGSAGDLIRFSVTDTGEGIRAEQQSKLFQPFVQAEASTTRRFGGTGLGLSISKRLVDLMGGKVGLSSEHGRGSCFWFNVSLPTADAPADLFAHQIAPAARKARILVAEDLPMNQELARATIERAGHHVDIASDGNEAVTAVQDQSYDLVLMDIQMPNMDGISATRAIRALDGPVSQVPILALTANVLPEQVRKFLAAGMNGHVAKPFRQKELHAAIAAALAGNREYSTEPASAEDVALDEDVFASVLEALPVESLRGHLKYLEVQIEEVATGSQADPGHIAAVAHKIVSQAGMLGLMRLSAAARRVEDSARDGANLELPLRSFRKSAGDLHTLIWPRIAARRE